MNAVNAGYHCTRCGWSVFEVHEPGDAQPTASSILGALLGGVVGGLVGGPSGASVGAVGGYMVGKKYG